VTAQTIITESYPVAKRGMAQAIYGMGVGPTLGPPLGGYIVDHFSWPYIFYQHPNWDYCHITNTFFVKVQSMEINSRLINRLVVSFLLPGSLQYILEHGQQDDWFNNLPSSS
jgi:DHA2 family multidrug resistance protein